jgi:hypothetical protein
MCIFCYGIDLIGPFYRLLALENSHALMRASLDRVLGLHAQAPNSHQDTTRSKVVRKESKPNEGTNPQVSGPLVADRNSRTAPASLIRDMKHYILGEEKGLQEIDASEDIVAKGIITDDLVQILLIG